MNKSLFFAVAFFSLSTLNASQPPVDQQSLLHADQPPAAPKQRSALYKACKGSFAALFQVLNSHPYVWTMPVAYYMYQKSPIKPQDGQNEVLLKLAVPMASWYMSGTALKASTKAVMKQAEIDPLEADDIQSAFRMIAHHNSQHQLEKISLLQLAREY